MRRIVFLLAFFLIFSGCTQNNNEMIPEQNNAIQLTDQELRMNSIPETMEKITPENDVYPPILHSDKWEQPIPLEYPINTQGAEDSPFISPDGNTLYFFFTPDPLIPVQEQVSDGVTGIYVSKKQNGIWMEPKKLILQEKGKLSLDGCQFISENKIWFCSAREGYNKMNWFTAELEENKGENIKYSNVLNDFYDVGELHIYGNEVYFHSPDDNGNYDLYYSKFTENELMEPKPIEILNTEQNEGWPFISSNGNELWFLRTVNGTPGIFYSQKINNSWNEPELIISWFAGEPSLDDQGNIYFVHHFYKDGVMLEADIYVAYKK